MSSKCLQSKMICGATECTICTIIVVHKEANAPMPFADLKGAFISIPLLKKMDCVACWYESVCLDIFPICSAYPDSRVGSWPFTPCCWWLYYLLPSLIHSLPISWAAFKLIMFGDEKENLPPIWIWLCFAHVIGLICFSPHTCPFA